MGAKYDSLLTRKENKPLSQIVEILLDLSKGEDY